MRIRRKFNLQRISVENPYETIEFESSEHEKAEHCLMEIEKAWRTFCYLKAEGKIS